jgi:hypothetical protein
MSKLNVGSIISLSFSFSFLFFFYRCFSRPRLWLPSPVLGGVIEMIENIRAGENMARAGTFIDLACGSGVSELSECFLFLPLLIFFFVLLQE